GRLERGADLELRERGVGMLARAACRVDQVDFAGSVADAPWPQSPIALAAVALGAADVDDAAVEAGAAVAFDAGAALVEQTPHRIGPLHAVDDVGDARDLVEARGQHLDIRVAMAQLGGGGAVPVAHRIEPQR